MNEETFNLSIRKFLKMVGVNSQREIEHAVATAVAHHATVPVLIARAEEGDPGDRDT